MVAVPYGGELRVGDAEREVAADRVRDAYVEGRLTHDELDSRLDAIHRAVTRDDLAVVGADLPVSKKKRRRGVVPWFYVEVNAVLWGIWGAQSLIAGDVHQPWPLVVSVPWGVIEGIGMARRAARRATPPSTPELTAS
jgi:hypothetical protein